MTTRRQWKKRGMKRPPPKPDPIDNTRPMTAEDIADLIWGVHMAQRELARKRAEFLRDVLERMMTKEEKK